MRSQKFHGRYDSEGRVCEAPQCSDAGEFRAPGSRGPGFDGPGEWRWFCLQHVREFNAGYDWFEGMSADEILAAQSPVAGWQTETRAFRKDAGADGLPRWADFHDPLDAIGARAGDIKRAARGRPQLRRRYSELVRRYHPDRNGGDRSHEHRLQRVVEAYQLLRRADGLE